MSRAWWLSPLLLAGCAGVLGIEVLEEDTSSGGGTAGTGGRGGEQSSGGDPGAGGDPSSAGGADAGASAGGAAGGGGAAGEAGGCATDFYRDADGDEYGDASDVVSTCSAPDGYVAQLGDCDDGAEDVNPDGVEVCDGFARDEDCSAGTSVCPDGCREEQLDDHGYVFCGSTRLNWPDASASCASLGLQLARVETLNENEWIKSELPNNAWLGGSDSALETEWRWEDGTQFWAGDETGINVDGQFFNWESGQPDGFSAEEDAVEMDDNTGEWRDTIAIGTTRDYVCEGY